MVRRILCSQHHAGDFGRGLPTPERVSAECASAGGTRGKLSGPVATGCSLATSVSFPFPRSGGVLPPRV